jgi:restriction endonuclease S subunit
MSTQSLKPGWKMVEFGDIAQNVAVRVDPADAKTDVYVGLEHLDPSTLHLRQWGHPSDVTGQKLAFKKGDVIFGRRRAYQRKLAVAEFDGICSAHAMVVRAKPEMILPEFLPFFLQSDMFMERAIEISVGSLSPTINWKTLKVQEFPLPPLDEQKHIAEILWAADRVYVRWKSLSESIMNLLGPVFMGFVRNGIYKCKTKITLAGKIPSHWDCVELENTCSHIVDCLHSTPEYSESGIAAIRTSDVIPGKILIDQARCVPENVYRERIVRLEPLPGDILYSREGERYGIAAPVEHGQKLCLAQRMMHFRTKPEMDSTYFLWLLNSPYIYRKATFDVGGTTSPHVNIRAIRNFPIPVPPLEEQHVIAQSMTGIFEGRFHVHSHVVRSRALKDVLATRFLNARCFDV